MNPEKWHESIAERVAMLQPCVDLGMLTVDEARTLIYSGPASGESVGISAQGVISGIVIHAMTQEEALEQYPAQEGSTFADAFHKGFAALPCKHDFQTHHLFTSSYRTCEKCGAEEC